MTRAGTPAVGQRGEQLPSTNRGWSSGMFRTEDWWSVWIGLGIFAASLVSLAGADLVGWMVRPRPWEWTDVANAFAWSKLLAPAGAAYAGWHPLASFAATYAVFTALFAVGARFLGLSVGRFVAGFTVLFVVTWAAWIIGNELHLTMVEPAPATAIVGDAFLLQRAVANLIDNALDFSPPGGTVSVEVVAHARSCDVVVRDAGPGIPEYAEGKVFEKFKP